MTTIQDWEDLADIEDNMSGSYTLANDLNAETDGYSEYASGSANGGDGWDPLGTNLNRFNGVLDGNGYKIEDLTILREGEDLVGLFAGIDTDGEVKNLTVDVDSIVGREEVGVFAGSSWGEITNCWANAPVDGVWDDPMTPGSVAWAGGLVGDNWGTITNCYATGAVTGELYVGGLVGENGSAGVISESYATGPVTGTMSGVGGLVGLNQGDITECYATGSVEYEQKFSDDDPIYVGGLVGANSDDGDITNSYATNAVFDSTADDSFYGGAIAGGILGNSSITLSYSAGNLTGETTGGIAGFADATATNVYYNSDESDSAFGETDAPTGVQTAVSESSMTGDSAEDSMDSLDFGSTWTTVDGDFPTLQFDAEDDEESVSVTTHSATDVDEDSATLNGELTELENADDATVSFEYGETGDGFPDSVEVDTLASPGSFEETITGLDSDTEYEFKAVAESDEDSDEGSVETFTTDEVQTGPVSVSATGEEIDPGEVATIDIDGTSVEEIRISAIWTDWDATDDVADGADFDADPIESDGYCEFTWDSQQDSVSLELGVTPPESTYVGGKFKLTVTGTDVDGETDETSAILEITD